jgi:hypothetical protein
MNVPSCEHKDPEVRVQCTMIELERRYQLTRSALRAARFDRVLRFAVELDQTIDGRAASAATPAGPACFADLVSVTRACIDTSTNRVVVDGVAVANQHVPLYSC